MAEIWATNSSNKICNKCFIHHCQGLKVSSFWCETVWFFHRWILIRFTWNLSRFVPNSVEILMCNFRKKLFRENFSEILCKPRLSSTETCEFSGYFLQFFHGFVLRCKILKKFMQVLSYILCTPVRRYVSKQITKKEDTGKKRQGVLFSENQLCSLSVWDLLPFTPWVFRSEIHTRHSSLCLLSFGWDLSPKFLPQDLQYIFYSSLPGLKGRFVFVWNSLIFFLGE